MSLNQKIKTSVIRGSRKTWLAALASASLLLVACGGGGTADQEPQSATDDTISTGDTALQAAVQCEEIDMTGLDQTSQMKLALGEQVNLIELHSFRTEGAYVVTAALYEPLLRQSFETGPNDSLIGTTTHVGAGAESFEVADTETGFVATFKLRENAKFTDGSPVTASDYKYTFDRTIEGPGYIGMLLPFIGVDATDQVRVIDDYTLEIETKVKSPLFERFMTFSVFGAMNKKVMDSLATTDDPWSFAPMMRDAAGSGAYKLKSFETDGTVVLEPNPYYWNAACLGNAGITILSVPDANQRTLLLQSGDVDYAEGIPSKLNSTLVSDDRVVIYSTPTSGVGYMAMNNTVKPLDNVNLRKAILHAVPYDALMEKVLFGLGSKAGGVVPSPMETHDSSIGDLYGTDLDLAKKYLADSGLKNVKLVLGVRQSKNEDQEAAVLIQDSLRKIGIEIEVNVLQDADFAEKQNKNELPLQIADWYSWGEDPFYQMTFLTTCGQWVNYSRFCDKGYDEIVAEGKFLVDPAARQEASGRAQQLFFDKAPWAPLWAFDRTTVAGKCVAHVIRDYTTVGTPQWLSKKVDC